LGALALLTTLRDKRRIFTGIGGVALAVALILLIEGFASGMFRQNAAYVDKNGADLYLGQKGLDAFSVSVIPRALETDIANTEGVSKVSSVYAIQIIFDAGERKTPAMLYGFRETSGMGGPWKLAVGRLPSGSEEIVIDRVLAKQNGLETGNEVQVLGRKYKIVGLSAETNAFMNPSMFVSEEGAAQSLSSNKTTSMFLIKADKPAQVNLLKEKLSQKFPDYSVFTWEEMVEKYTVRLDEVVGAPLTIILVITFLVGLMTVGLTAHMSVLARLKEYGVLKAIGAGNRVLYTMVIMESLFSVVFGFGLGFVVSRLAAWLIMEGAPQFSIIVSFNSLVKAGAMAVVISMLAVILPVRRIALWTRPGCSIVRGWMDASSGMEEFTAGFDTDVIEHWRGGSVCASHPRSAGCICRIRQTDCDLY